MKTIVFVCLQNELVEDLETEKNLDMGDYNYDLTCLTSLEDIDSIISQIHPDLVVLSYNALKKRDSWNFGNAEIAYHAIDRDELNAGASSGFPTIGIASTGSEIAEKLNQEPYAAPAVKSAPEQDDLSSDEFDLEEFDDVEEKEEKPSKQPKKAANQAKAGKKKEEPKIKESSALDYLEDDDETDDLFDIDFDLDEDEEEKPENQPKPQKKENTPVKEQGEGQAPARQKAMPKPKKEPEQEDYIEKEFKKDISGEEHSTTVVTVYSAKGGVGKTTIATELATYLSLVSVGRRKLRVCLVDYNIDFGDVRMTLNLSPKDLNLTDWAAEVQEFLDNGRTAENIEYSRKEMDEYLSYDKKSGLSILQAPLTNEDSMGISSDALSIILDNIVENGGFDYVICDTGNNTRDSTMIALERANIILMIMTQNANTANCDKAFMSTMETIEFDMSNTKLVINNIMPQKATKISVQEIIDFFPFECVGKIKFNTDVIKAANMAEPLAYQPDHEFTKQLRNIVTYILQQDDYEVNAKPKKRFLDFLHKDKEK